MLKLRLQGTTNDIKWFRKILERDKRIKVIDFSEFYQNKGTKRYFRVYVNIEKETKQEERRMSRVIAIANQKGGVGYEK